MTLKTWVVWVTSVVDEIDHALTDEDMSAGMSAGLGRYAAVCGKSVVPAALTAPPGRACPGCAEILRPSASCGAMDAPARRPRRRPHRLPGLRERVWARLLSGRCRSGRGRST
jgi:hypothetical protein